MTEAKSPAQASSEPSSGGSFWLFVALSLVVALVLLLGLRFGVGVDIDGPTIGLAVACVVMIWSLRAMWAMVVALSRPTVETLIVEAELGADRSTLAELREEKRRVLRAIKELEFDHDMGKLSDEDFREVGGRYRLRAIEVMRQLDDSDALHPELAAHLEALGVKLRPPEAAPEAAPKSAPEAAPESASEVSS
ncbi:hypothetical protein ENSA5_30560 [Enhygromyxa salina]|uniref:Uncharacterized protein n=1 Tax=Enhygromyxa salina TaxID=215803 RepID=A0A2S9XZQ4_9BACT|nr:hypothetical protein [Enhygromyxa salina]PRP98323.1 hypothetical protein ENSA5_30560 [Enhygromyxa salina]